MNGKNSKNSSLKSMILYSIIKGRYLLKSLPMNNVFLISPHLYIPLYRGYTDETWDAKGTMSLWQGVKRTASP